MINNINDAIKACKNEIILHGTLRELNIDFDDRGDSIVVKYKGVVSLYTNNDIWIRFYGIISNNSPMFESIINELKSLNAFIKTISTNGEIDETNYSDLASIVYIRGVVMSATSIKAEYIAHGKESNEDYYLGEIKGIIIGVNDIDNEITLLILDSYYHKYITLPCQMTNYLYQHSIETFNVVLNSYRDNKQPISCERVGVYIDVDESVIEQAKLEHDIYENSIGA